MTTPKFKIFYPLHYLAFGDPWHLTLRQPELRFC
jgi:hypothetical protein